MDADISEPPEPSSGVTTGNAQPPAKRGCGWLLLALVSLSLVSLYLIPTFLETRKRQGKRMATTLADSIERYFAENGNLPAPALSPSTGKDVDTDTRPDSGLLARLKGESGGGRIDFLNGLRMATPDPNATLGWKNGLFGGVSKGSFGLVDQAGHPYRVRLDANGDRAILNPNSAQVTRGRTFLQKRVIVWSAGRDGDWSTWDDNVCSWD